MPQSSQDLVFNGVDAGTGQYLLSPMPASVVAQIARGEKLDPRHLAELKQRHWNSSRTTLGVGPGIDATKLEQAGWGAIFPSGSSPAVREALQPLLALRRSQAGPRYREDLVYQPNDGKEEFLGRLGVAYGPVMPGQVPYYLLIVGDPESIPFRFQYLLDVQYAVGRIWFETPEEYANYARSVVAAETKLLGLPRKVVFFAPRNEGDEATRLSATDLATPLASGLLGQLKPGSPAWEAQSLIGAAATKQALTRVLGGEETPAVLFSASHGVGFPNGHPRQGAHQGALLCQDWPGPAWNRPIPADHYFSRDDVASSANPFGLIAFFFACYGAGTPRDDDFPHQASLDRPREIAPRPFLAGLPRRLLSHSKGGALAVVGHVDRAWGYSFTWPGAGRQIQTFEAMLTRLLDGHPIGHALEYFNERYAELSTSLSSKLEELKFGRRSDDTLMAGLWTANNDARSYVVIGDPAVRVAVHVDSPPEWRPDLALSELPAAPAFIGERTSPAAPEPSDPGDEPAPWLSILAATEQRYRDRETAPRPAVSFGPGTPSVFQANPPDRIRKRLARAGVPAAEADGLLMPAEQSFATVRDNDGVSAAADALERILGRNDLIGVEFLAAAMVASRSVGRVLIRTRPGYVVGYGSGAMVSPRLFLTNNHVVGTVERAALCSVEFDYEYSATGQLRNARAFSFAPEDFFLTHAGLDFTLVAVRPESGLEDFGWLTLKDDDGAVLQDEYVNIVQHPGGRPKQVALRDNKVTDILPDFLHYRADTEPGSSGAPVFNDQWEFVGLHHSGVARKNERGEILARDGGLWVKAMGEREIDWIANEGIRTGRILAWLNGAEIPAAHRPYRDALNSGVVSPSIVAAPRRSTSVEWNSSTADSPSAASTSVTAGFPLRITITIDHAGGPAACVVDPAGPR